VTDVDDDPTSAAVPVISVTPPGGVVAHPAVVNVGTGLYQFTYLLAAAGRHLVAAVAADPYGMATTAVYAEAQVSSSGMPTLANVQTYLRQYSWTDPEMQAALDAEAAAQRAKIRPSAVYGADLREALLRRVARNLAMRGLPLAVLAGDGDGNGPQILPGRDPEVRRLEAPYRKITFG
jgi:hypothetical protein